MSVKATKWPEPACSRPQQFGGNERLADALLAHLAGGITIMIALFWKDFSLSGKLVEAVK